VIVRQLIPEGLAEMAPGPELGALLAGIEAVTHYFGLLGWL